MTDSILRSYQSYSYTSMVPFPVPVALNDADMLLEGETDGFAINATTIAGTPAYFGAPGTGYVSVIDTGTPANDLSNAPLNKANLTYSGTSPKVVHWGSSPYVRYASHNLIRASQELDAGAWIINDATSGTVTANATTAPNGTSTGDALISYSGASANTTRWQSFGGGGFGPPGTESTLSVYAKPNGYNFIELYVTNFSDYAAQSFNVSTGATGNTRTSTWTISNASITSAGGGWYRCALTVFHTNDNVTGIFFSTAPTDAFGSLYTGDGTSGIYMWGAQVCHGAEAGEYLPTTNFGGAVFGIPQSYDAAAAKYGILSEASATNKITRSENFSHSDWTKSEVTVTADNIAAPNGSMTADRINESDNTAEHQIYFAIGSAADTGSVYAKAGTRSWIKLCFDNGANTGAFFDLTNGVVGTIDSTYTAAITPIGGGWYRCSVSKSDQGYLHVFTCTADNSSLSYDGTTTNNVYLWGAQAEDGFPFASSYIPTGSSTSTRAADVVSAADSAFPGSDTNFSVYLDYKPLDVSSGTRYGWSYWKDSSNAISLIDDTADPKMRNRQGGSDEFSVDLGTLVAGTRTQVSIAAKASDFDGSQDGAGPTAQGTATLTTGYTTLYLGTTGATASELNGYIYRMVFVPRQVQTTSGDLTTWRYNF